MMQSWQKFRVDYRTITAHRGKTSSSILEKEKQAVINFKTRLMVLKIKQQIGLIGHHFLSLQAKFTFKEKCSENNG